MSFEENNYYQVLQVDSNADQVDIDASFRRLARLYHPDRNESTFATTFMQELNVAYSALRDPRQRLEYDKMLDARAAEARAARRQRAASIHRWLVIPAIIALFLFAFVVLVDPATRIGSRSIRSNSLRAIVSATEVALRLEETEALVVANPTEEPPKSVVQSVLDSLMNEEPTEASASSLTNSTAPSDESVDASISSRSAISATVTPDIVISEIVTKDDAVIEGGDAEQTVALQPTANQVTVETATMTATPFPTPTLEETATTTLEPTSKPTSGPTSEPTATAIGTAVPTSTSEPVPSESAATSTDSVTEVADLFRGVVTQDTMLHTAPQKDSAFAPAYGGSSLQTVARTSDGLWYRLDNGYWIEARFVSQQGDEASTPSTPSAASAVDTVGGEATPDPATKPTVDPVSDPTVDSIADSTTEPTATITRSINLDFPWQGIAIRDTDLYSVPGQENAIVAGIFKGTSVTVVAVSNDGKWYQLNDAFWLAVDAVDSN